MKYIMFEDFSGKPLPIIFPERIDFLELREQMPYADILSAGHIALREGRLVVRGGSAELKAKSRDEDAAIIAEKLMRDAPKP